LINYELIIIRFVLIIPIVFAGGSSVGVYETNVRVHWLQRLEAIARYFAFEKGAYCPNLRLEERLANKTDEWVM